MFVTRADIDVRFIWKSATTTAFRLPMSSGGPAYITSSERSASTSVTNFSRTYGTSTVESHAPLAESLLFNETQTPPLTESVSTLGDPFTSVYIKSTSMSPITLSSAESSASFSNIVSFSSETTTSIVSDSAPPTATPFESEINTNFFFIWCNYLKFEYDSVTVTSFTFNDLMLSNFNGSNTFGTMKISSRQG